MANQEVGAQSSTDRACGQNSQCGQVADHAILYSDSDLSKNRIPDQHSTPNAPEQIPSDQQTFSCSNRQTRQHCADQINTEPTPERLEELLKRGDIDSFKSLMKNSVSRMEFGKAEELKHDVASLNAEDRKRDPSLAGFEIYGIPFRSSTDTVRATVTTPDGKGRRREEVIFDSVYRLDVEEDDVVRFPNGKRFPDISQYDKAKLTPELLEGLLKQGEIATFRHLMNLRVFRNMESAEAQEIERSLARINAQDRQRDPNLTGFEIYGSADYPERGIVKGSLTSPGRRFGNYWRNEKVIFDDTRSKFEETVKLPRDEWEWVGDVTPP